MKTSNVVNVKISDVHIEVSQFDALMLLKAGEGGLEHPIEMIVRLVSFNHL